MAKACADAEQSEPPVSLLPVAAAVAQRQVVPSQKLAPQLVPREALRAVLARVLQALGSLGALQQTQVAGQRAAPERKTSALGWAAEPRPSAAEARQKWAAALELSPSKRAALPVKPQRSDGEEEQPHSREPAACE